MAARRFIRLLAVFAAIATLAIAAPAHAAEDGDSPAPRQAVQAARSTGNMSFTLDCLDEQIMRTSPAGDKNTATADGAVLRAVQPIVATSGCTGGGGNNDNDTTTDPVIDNGTTVSPAPGWIASIEQSDGSACSGALVHAFFVITSVVCTENMTTVRLGSKNPTSGGLTVAVDSVIPHFLWEGSPSFPDKFNVAVIKLQNAAAATPVPLASPSKPGVDTVTVYGYGTDDGPDVLRSSTADWDNDFPVYIPISGGGTLDLTDYGTRVCAGDSGGPAVTASGELFSITSWVDGPDSDGCSTVAWGINLRHRFVHDWLTEAIYDNAAQSFWREMHWAGDDPGTATGLVPGLPEWAGSLGFSDPSFVGDLMAWKELQNGWTYLDGQYVEDDPATELDLIIDGCVDNPGYGTAAEYLDGLEATEFTGGNSDVTWFCETAGTSTTDLLVGAAYQMWRWDTPVAVDTAAGSFVMRRIDFDVAGTNNDSGSLAAACGWQPAATLNTSQAITACVGAAITPVRVLGRDMTSSDKAFTIDDFATQILASMNTNEILFDPPASANYASAHVPAAQ